MVSSRPHPKRISIRHENHSQSKNTWLSGDRLISRVSRAVAVTLAGLLIVSGPANARDYPDLLEMPARMSELAQSNLLVDVSAAGSNLVAIGIKGHVLFSEDNGVTWVQSEVPTSTDLTAAHFISERVGWVVGHDQVILHTRDGGGSWELQHSNIATNEDGEADFETLSMKPLLDVYFRDKSQGWAVGAYGLMLKTTNGGKSWKRVILPNLNPEREEWDPVALESHMNSITVTEAGEMYLAGELGQVYYSTDWGQSWEARVTPYSGSFFGITVTNYDMVFAYGLRGNMFASKDTGRTWTKVDTQTLQTLLGGYYNKEDNTVIIVGTQGAILYSGDGGERFDYRIRDNRKDLVNVVGTGDGKVAVVGFRGVELLKATGDEL